MKKFLILLLIILGIVAYFIWDAQQKKLAETRIQGSGTIETTEVEVGSRVGGRISSVLFHEGDHVKPGDVLVTLEPYQIPAQREALQAELAQAEARLQELQNGPRPQEIAAAQAQYKEAQARSNLIAIGPRSEEIEQAAANRRRVEADMENARQNYQRFQTLLNRHVISQQEFDQATTTYRVAQEQFNAAVQRETELRRGSRPQEIVAAKEQAKATREQWQLLKAGTRPEDIAAQQAMAESIRAQIQQLDVAGSELQIKSPCACEISSMDIRKGQIILANQTLASLTNLDDLWVRVFIPEERFGQVKTGDKASVKVDPYPKKLFDGKVVQLSSRAEYTPRNVQTEETRKIQVFGVKVSLNNRERLLRPGMPADVTFFLKQNQHQ